MRLCSSPVKPALSQKEEANPQLVLTFPLRIVRKFAVGKNTSKDKAQKSHFNCILKEKESLKVVIKVHRCIIYCGNTPEV